MVKTNRETNPGRPSLAFPLARNEFNIFHFFRAYCPRVMKGRARDKNRERCSRSDFHRSRSSRQPPVAANRRVGDGRPRKNVATSRFAMHPSATGSPPPDARSRRFIYDSCIIPARRAITFISIMTGEQLNLHGKSHRPRNETRPRFRNSRSIGVRTSARITFRILYMIYIYMPWNVVRNMRKI